MLAEKRRSELLELVRRQGFAPLPDLAESWDSSEGGLVYTFKLRNGSAFSDGAPITAKEVEFSLMRWRDMPDSWSAPFYLSNIKDIQAIDDMTVRFFLSAPSPIFPLQLGTAVAKIVREEALRTLALDPTHDGAYHVLGRWNAEIMRLSGLSRFFAKRFLGAGIFSQASWEKAIANLQKAVELDPQRIYHRLELARIYADRKRYQEARDQLGRISSLPDRELLDPLYRERALELQRKIGDRT